MKKMMLIALMSLVAMNASAFAGAGADQEYTVFSCVQTPLIPDNTISLKVITGGFAGLTRIELERSTFAGPSTSNYYVRQVTQTKKTPPSHIAYTGKDIRLAISSNEDSRGYRPATLSLLKGKNRYDVNMYCQMHLRAL